MKKSIVMVMVLWLCLTLVACGKNKTVKAVESAIDNIGKVSLDSVDEIETAERLFNILTENEKEKVDNRIVLVEARKEYDELVFRNLLEVADAEEQKPNAIEQQDEQRFQQSIVKVLPGGYNTIIENYEDTTGLVSEVYQGKNGYAVKTIPEGHGGDITMMVGIDNEGKVMAIDILSCVETAGLGLTVATDTPEGENFRAQFVGSSEFVAVSNDGGTIDAISGATITSRAICDGVNAALECVAGLN